MAVSILLILLFVLLVVTGILLLNKPGQNWKVLLLGSVLFYMIVAKWAAIPIFLFSLVVFFGGKIIERTKGKLAYYGIITMALTFLLLEKLGLFTKVGLPLPFVIIGISYITFNGLSYLFDIRKSYLKPETNYGLLLLYLLYFPYISAGPLHRYKKVASQFRNNVGLSNQNFSLGFRLILWGIFKNLVLGQYLGKLVAIIIDSPDVYKGFYVIIGGFFFFLYLYCDFSSFIDIVRGTSHIFGIQLSQNFRSRVYASSSRRQFWEGWHITLNHWFRDYIFYRIAGKARKKWQIDLAMMVTFVMIGIWHDVSWKFVLWGFINGTWIITEDKLRKRLGLKPGTCATILGTLYHVSVASFVAIVFRTPDLGASVKALLSSSTLPTGTYLVIIKQIIYISPFFVLMDYIYRKAGQKPIEEYLGTLSLRNRWAIYILLTACILIFGSDNNEDAYYMQF
ncbi:MBOAT family O-acyltransferase [Emticicia sp. 21SJ11W-3]|uniref:MBOAT family O-acyltransferase n=1 Tax=Emticicia sp. 21SJ11W-3 TaxID=2916755 RepID=UPI00209E089D|nr:MBOAT family O-acyltransferase [Emticicia sp. 21SJ11W-3]UTA67849.1 hypothetical protein MB380_19950 [Emticicia sp. 21SJ11W-3]